MTDEDLLDELFSDLDAALDRAEHGYATRDDWKLIRLACGVSGPQLFTVTIGANDGIDCDSQRRDF
jgi:hypothetical protein